MSSIELFWTAKNNVQKRESTVHCPQLSDTMRFLCLVLFPTTTMALQALSSGLGDLVFGPEHWAAHHWLRCAGRGRPQTSSPRLHHLLFRLICCPFQLLLSNVQRLEKYGRIDFHWENVPTGTKIYPSKECFLFHPCHQLIACSKNSLNMDHIHNLRSARMPRMEAGRVQPV